MNPQGPAWTKNKWMSYSMIAGMAVFVGYFVFSLIYSTNPPPNAEVRSPKASVVIIPKGSSLQAQGKPYLLPQNVSVVLGVNNTVSWLNQDSVPVNIESDAGYVDRFSGPFNSTRQLETDPGGAILPSKMFNFTFTQPGTYPYHDASHPWVRGTVIVALIEK